ncbi:RND transporter [Nocardioides dubius]
MGKRPTTRSIGVILFGLVALPLLVIGLSRTHLETGLESFLPADDHQVAAYDQVTRQFGGDPIVVLVESTEGEGLDADRVEELFRLEGELAALGDVAAVYGPATLLNQVAGRAQDLLTQLVGRRDLEINKAKAEAKAAGGSRADLERAAAKARSSFDLRYGPLLVQAMPGGLPTLSNPDFINQVVRTEAGNIRAQWHFLVPNRRSVAILVRPAEGTSAAQASALVEQVRADVERAELPDTEVTVTGVPVLISAISDTAIGEGPRLALLAVAGVGLCLFAATWLRRSRRLAPLAVTLLAVAGAVAFLGWTGRPVSLGVVAFCSVLLGMGCYYPTYFAMGARRRTVLVVAAASAASLATLGLSPLPLVHDLGLTLAVGIVLAAGLGVLLRPWLADGAATPNAPEPDNTVVEVPCRKTAVRVLAGALTVVAVGGWWALPALGLETDVEQFAGGLSVYRDAEHVQQVIGSSGEVDVVLRGPDVLSPEALTWLRDANEAIVLEHGDVLAPVTSPVSLFSFLGRNPTVDEIEAAARLLPAYLLDSAVTRDRRTAVLSFGTDVGDLDALRAVTRDLDRTLALPPPGYDLEITGLPIVALHAQDLISSDRLLANVAGIAVAGLVLALGLTRRGDAARAVWSAVLATGWGFALLYLFGIPLNPVTVGLGALTVAVGCEFTVVQAEAIRTGSRTLRRAVGVVAATSAVGYLVLLSSGLAAVRGFGALLAGAVALAALASWVVVRASVAPELPDHHSGSDETAEPLDKGELLCVN